MKRTKQQRLFIRLIVVSSILLLLLLAGFQSIWVLAGSASGIMNQTGLQRTRAQAIVKDILILSYRPEIEHAQAVNELQNTLPRFEQTQRGLQVGDPQLALPTHVPEDILPYINASQSDYLALDTAARRLLATADGHTDPLQVNIVLAHEHDYTVAMTAIVNAWQARIDGAFLHIFWIEMGIDTLLILLLAGKYAFLTRRVLSDLLIAAQAQDTQIPPKERL